MICNLWFDRIQLNESDQYLLTDEELNDKLYNFVKFDFATAKELSKREEPLLFLSLLMCQLQKKKKLWLVVAMSTSVKAFFLNSLAAEAVVALVKEGNFQETIKMILANTIWIDSR